ncbi:V-type ATP synthase subunit F [Aerococcaceae bacterium WS4759]|uniref:V-type ATP synthase subunit F n=1 Tax=Fundicoccus ignavus TaxID=2664442 RepID=A0A6I2GLD1_9LACT|nr:V-type ATP synthase subunit F [Fundicoccus ignavus]MRI85368.1 V-type ATP synthase subunit F [Fundicoccus ignavus]
MAKQYKIAVMGNRDSILPFKIIGFDTYPVNEGSEAKKLLNQLAKQNYGIIYLTENIAAEIPDVINFYDAQVTPAIILIPTHKGRLGIGAARIQENVKKAVGQDIL